MLRNNEARRMAGTLTEDLEELDYMRESGREGMWEGGSEESFAKDSVSIHTLFVFLNENTPFHVLRRKHTISHFLENTPVHFYEHNICTYVYICTYIYI